MDKGPQGPFWYGCLWACPPPENFEIWKLYFQRSGHQIVYKYELSRLTAIPNHAECAMRRDLDLEIEVKSTSIRLRLDGTPCDIYQNN